MASIQFAIKWTGSNTYFFHYDTVTAIVSSTTNPTNIGYEILPPVGKIIYYECDGFDLIQYIYTGGLDTLAPTVGVNTLTNNASCCTLNASQFQVTKTNNTDLTTPNGTIEISAPDLNIMDFEVSIDGGDTWIQPVDNELIIEDLPAGTYTLVIRNIGGVCFVSAQASIINVITYPPLIIAETVAPAEFSPVFSPIEFQFELVNNQISIKEDLTGTYLEVETDDGIDFFSSLPIFKILENEDYQGVWQITSVDDIDAPTKFYFDAEYTTDQDAIFVPFGQQVFQLYGESDFNTFKKVADISVAPTSDGVYKIRCERFLQSLFELVGPADEFDLSLHRKFYMLPYEFDQEGTSSIRTAVFSTESTLTPYIGDLIPLGPMPINFINEVTAKGYPVIFSVLDNDAKRVKNIRSSIETEITTTADEIYFPALPNNTYQFAWINTDGAIADLNTVPALPSWITVNASDSSVVDLTINTFEITGGGDYIPDDYLNTDYLSYGINAIVGCYTFEFYDGATLLFTLSTCVFPAQEVKSVCKSNSNNSPDIFNIAWINKEGGWSSFVFEGKKEFSRSFGTTKTFKRNGIRKKASIDNVYDQVAVSFANLNIRELIFIASLRTSIEAYLYNEVSNDWDIPIFLNTESFPIYKMPFKQIETVGAFTFLYAEELKIQNQ